MTPLMTRRARFAAVTLVVLGLALAGCVPSDGSPGSAGVPMMGQSRVSGADLARFVRANSGLPYRAANIGLDQLADLYVSEGNRYNVRGDIAFAQSIVETAWFNFPDYGQVRTTDNNFSGIGACDSCGTGFGFSTPLAGIRAQLQLLRNYADGGSSVANIPDAPIPELWGSNPATAAYNFDHYFAKGRAPLWNNMGNGNWATAPNYSATVLRVYNQILTQSGQAGQCPADGLTFGPLTDAGPCPVSLRQPGRAIASNGTAYYVLNGSGAVSPFHGGLSIPSMQYPSDFFRDIAMMPDGQGYVALDAYGGVWKYGSAARDDTLQPLESMHTSPNDLARSVAIMPDGKGYMVLLGDGTIGKFGSAAQGVMATLPGPSFGGLDYGRAIEIMPDGQGYVVLDKRGLVSKFGTAFDGLVGAATTPLFEGDGARDIKLIWNGVTLGYYVLDSFGGVHAGGQLPPKTNPGLVFADRWRSLTVVDGKLLLLKNDGATVYAN